MFELIPLVIALAAFIFARKAITQTRELRARLDALEAAGLARVAAPATDAATTDTTAASIVPPPLPDIAL